jgi:hypothetical protein
MSVGRSAAMVPNYAKGKLSALRILELNQRQSKIDPSDPSGTQLVSSFDRQSIVMNTDVCDD